MAGNNEIARATIYLDGKQAESALKGLETRAAELKEQLKQVKATGDQVSIKKLEKELSGVENAQRSLRKETFEYQKVLNNLNGASLNDLKKALKTIDIQMGRLGRMDPGYSVMQKQAMALKTEIAKINNQFRAQGSFFERMADGANRYFQLITVWVAGMAGVFLGMKRTIDAFNEFEERLDNLSSLTGLAGEELEWLSGQAKELSKSMLESGIRVTQSATEIVDAFTKVGSARPELLKDKEALKEVTQEAIILSNAAKMKLQPAIEALTMVMNQYNVPATEARRIINTLAAGSKEGAGEIPYLTVGFEKAGTVAADANVSIETLAATLETLAPRISAPEIAGRSLKGVLLNLQKGADDTNPKIVGFTAALDNLGKKNLSTTQLLKIFGTENITTARILINNVGELKKYEAALTGTNTAIEQASTNTDNNNSKLAQAKNRLNLIAIDLGQKLSPAYGSIVSKSTLLLKGVAALVDIFSNYGRVIVGSTVAMGVYTLALKFNTEEKRRNFLETRLGIALDKTYATVKGLLTGQISLATIAQKAWNTAIKANPVGAILAVVVAAGTALWQYAKSLDKVTVAQKQVNDVEIEAQQNIVEQKNKVEDLVKAASTETNSLLRRQQALALLNKISPEYFGNLDLETVKTDAARKATDGYSEALLKNARAAAAREKIVEIEKEKIEMEISGKDADIKWYQAAWNMVKSFGNGAVFASNQAVTGINNAIKKQDEFNQKMAALKKIIKENSSGKLIEDNAGANFDTGGIANPGEMAGSFIKSGSQEQKDAFKDYFSNLGEDAYDEFIKAIEKSQEEREKLPKLLPEDAVDKDLDYALSRYYETIEGQKVLLDAQKQAGIITEQEYQDKVSEINRKAEEKRVEDATEAEKEKFRKRDEFFQKSQDLVNIGAGMVQALMEVELEKAGDNEEKKARIRKKYANLQFTATVAQIAVNTAGAIMKGFEQLGPIGGAVAAVMLGTTGLAQVATANAQRKNILGYSEGGYTVEGEKNKPAGIVHAGEWVAPQEMVRSEETGPVIRMLENIRKRRVTQSIGIPVRQFSTGGYAWESTGQDQGSNNQGNAAFMELLGKNIDAIEKLMKWEPTIYTEVFKKDLETLDKINKSRGL